MKSREIISIAILALGLMAAILPGKNNDSIELNERNLLNEMLQEDNYISVDELAHLLISGDPSIQLIDVRPSSEFKQLLPRAINIPLDSIFSENYAYIFDQDIMKNIIYGPDDRAATQIWMITTQLGYKNNYLLKGGMEAWKSTILNPQYPAQTASQDEIDLYQKRMASRQYFTGAKALPKVNFQPIMPVKGKKKKRVEGGCS